MWTERKVAIPGPQASSQANMSSVFFIAAISVLCIHTRLRVHYTCTLSFPVRGLGKPDTQSGFPVLKGRDNKSSAQTIQSLTYWFYAQNSAESHEKSRACFLLVTHERANRPKTSHKHENFFRTRNKNKEFKRQTCKQWAYSRRQEALPWLTDHYLHAQFTRKHELWLLSFRCDGFSLL